MGELLLVPEGPHDRRQARSAWVAMQKNPVPEGRPKSRSVSEEAEIRSIVPLGRGYFPRAPGTSCLATIMLSLRDKRHSEFPSSSSFVLGFFPGINPGCAAFFVRRSFPVASGFLASKRSGIANGDDHHAQTAFGPHRV